MNRSWIVFCRVVDHYGDAGVCWRLAKHLAVDHQQAVQLCIDAPQVLAKLVPNLGAEGLGVVVESVRIVPFDAPCVVQGINHKTVVVETFGCGLPDGVLAEMAALPKPPLWVNLDYLTAESWVNECHGLLSPHPRWPLAATWWCPGYGAKAGGLIREPGVEPEPLNRGFSRRALLFCYPGSAAEQWPAVAISWRVTVPTVGMTQAEGADHPEGARRVRVPFVPQSEFDVLLRAHDFLVVRGEDSFVRAQYTGLPFVWNIYPQEDGAHWPKLNAFLDQWCTDLAPEIAEVVRDFWWAMNGQGHLESAWQAFEPWLPEIHAHAWQFATTLCQSTPLGARLVEWAQRQMGETP